MDHLHNKNIYDDFDIMKILKEKIFKDGASSRIFDDC